MVTDFSAAEKDRGVKFCMLVGLLCGQVFSPFGELWLAGSHDGGITSGMNHLSLSHQLDTEVGGRTRGEFDISSAGTCGEARWAVGIGSVGVA